jgi:predicted dithiol-disulfide oxidoreductase (DUF899 family)
MLVVLLGIRTRAMNDAVTVVWRSIERVKLQWGSEMSFAPTVPNQHHRAGDLVDPSWSPLDMTPEGRGDFFSKVNYD